MISPVLFEFDNHPLKPIVAKKPKLTLQLKNMRSPSIIPSPETARHSHSSSLASNIIRVNDYLYFGGHPSPNDLKTLKKANIAVVVNLASGKLPNSSDGQFQFLNYTIEDAYDENFDAKMRSIIRDIHTHIQTGKGVYVHCRKGISRAPCMVMAYLIVYENHTYQQSMKIIQTLKPNVDLNIWFIQALRRIAGETLLE